MELRRLSDKEFEERLAASGRKHKLHKHRIVINLDQFEQMCRIQCTKREIASVFGISTETLESRTQEQYGWFDFTTHSRDNEPTKYVSAPTYDEVFLRFAQEGVSALRRAQYKMAIQKENVTMQIWLGKQLLGQKDYPSDAGVSDKEQVTYDIREKLYSTAASSKTPKDNK